MQSLFEVAAGSVPGRDRVGAGNLLVGRNRQDAWAWHAGPEALVAVACDGCGSGGQSEVGAQLGARLFVSGVRTALKEAHLQADDDAFWEQIRLRILASLARVARNLDDDLEEVVHELFLFTIVAAVLTPRATVIVSAGDGSFAVNGVLTRLGPYADNQPPYLAYGLLAAPGSGAGPRLQVQHGTATDAVNSLLLATDGVDALVAAEYRRVPGKPEAVGPLSQFWTSDRYFRNPDSLRRRLALINSEHVCFRPETRHLVRELGLLPDDCTLIVLRRKATGGS